MKVMRYKHAGLLKAAILGNQKLEGMKYNKSGGQNIHVSKQVLSLLCNNLLQSNHGRPSNLRNAKLRN